MSSLAPDYTTEDVRDVFSGRMCCITAHPDDESLWAGGLLQKGDWTVICCSIPHKDPIRAYKFYRACDVLGVKGIVLPFPEGESTKSFSHMDVIDLDLFDGVLTHNSSGEYGHIHHKSVHHWVVENFKGNIWTFGFGEGEYVHRLSKDEVERKMCALQSYDHKLPYMGRLTMKWEALLHRYMRDQDFTKESFDAYPVTS